MDRESRSIRIAILAGVGLIIALIAGGVSVSKWRQTADADVPSPTDTRVGDE